MFTVLCVFIFSWVLSYFLRNAETCSPIRAVGNSSHLWKSHQTFLDARVSIPVLWMGSTLMLRDLVVRWPGTFKNTFISQCHFQGTDTAHKIHQMRKINWRLKMGSTLKCWWREDLVVRWPGTFTWSHNISLHQEDQLTTAAAAVVLVVSY